MRFGFVVGILLAGTPGAAGAAQFIFPGEPPTISSESGLLNAGYNAAAHDDGGYRFVVTDRDAKELAGFSFLRTVDGAWQGASHTLFVNNRTGSNVADCLVFRGAVALTFESLREVLNRPDSGPKDTDWIKPAQLGKDSHYFLTCEKWVNDTVVDLTIEGHTDYAGEAFKYYLRYDLDQRAFTLRKP